MGVLIVSNMNICRVQHIYLHSQGAGLVALKAYPLQFEAADKDHNCWREKMTLESFASGDKTCTAKLKKHYKRLGFLTVRGTPFMVCSTAFRLPSIENFLHRQAI
jgi:hypothetical protein